MAGLYIHIPFCRRKCTYCDFASYPGRMEAVEAYVGAVIKEACAYKSERVDTVFIGGGTPSLLPPRDFLRLIGGVRESINIAEGAEFTIEANPETVTHDKLSAWSEAGVNRLSMGLQAVQPELLKMLGRHHTAQDFTKAVDAAGSVGIVNINADLMTGLPGQTPRQAAESARFVSGLSHVSVYSLKLEEGTPLRKRVEAGELAAADDDTDRDCFYAAAEVLRAAGMRRYEISNFAQPGRECAHNLVYWRREEYIGLGAAAHSFWKGWRFANTSGLDDYIELMQKNVTAEVTREDVRDQDRFEKIMLGTRLAEGVERGLIGKIDERLISGGLARIENGRFMLTDSGMDIQNAVLGELI